MVGRDAMLPPAEDKVKAIAKIINCDADYLLAKAGRLVALAAAVSHLSNHGESLRLD